MSKPDAHDHSRLQYSLPSLVLTIIAAVAVYVTFNHFIEFSGFAVAGAKVAIGLVTAAVVDNFVLGRFNTIEEIHEGNVAYAIVYFGLMLIIAAAVVSI